MNLSDLTLARNLAEKKSLDGSILESEGNFEMAKKSYLESVAQYKELEPTATVLNNVSLVYSKLYYLTLDIKYLDLESEAITQATTLAPTNSILLSNAYYTNETYANLILQSEYFENEVSKRSIYGPALEIHELKKASLRYFNSFPLKLGMAAGK